MRKLPVILVAAVATVLLLGGSAAATQSGPSGGPSYVTWTTPANAFDASTSTYWQGSYNTDLSGTSSPFTTTSWRIVYGYTQTMSVTAATVTYAADYRFVGTGAHLDCSMDGTTWTQLATLAVAQTQTVTFGATACQWVSVYMEAPGTGYTPAVSEVTIVATPGPPAPVTFANAVSLVAVGDSITAGVNSPTPYTSDLPVWKQLTYYNQGVSGYKTSDMLLQFPTSLATGGQVVVIMGGTNDCQFAVPTATTMANLDSMVTQAQTANRLPVLVGPIPRTNHVDNNGGDHHACLLTLRTAMSAYAAAHSIPFVDPWTAFETGTGNLDPALTSDGTHPNARGAFILARLIAHAAGWGFTGD